MMSNQIIFESLICSYSNVDYFVSVGMGYFYTNKTHNNRQPLVLINDHSFYIHNKTDKHFLASVLLLYVYIQDFRLLNKDEPSAVP